MVSSLIRKYDVIIIILISRLLKKGESRHCFFIFGWIKLKCGVRGNCGFLISNLHSKTQYRFKILRKMPLLLPSFIVIWLEMAKLGGGGGGTFCPPVILGWQKTSPNRVKFRHEIISSNSIILCIKVAGKVTNSMIIFRLE